MGKKTTKKFETIKVILDTPVVTQWEAIKMWDEKFRVTPDPAIVSWETMEKILDIKIKR